MPKITFADLPDLSKAGKRQIADLFAAKSADLDTVLNAGDDMTPEDLDVAKKVGDQVKSLHGALKGFADTDSLRASAAAAKAFRDTPAGFVQPDGHRSADTPGLDVVGAVKAGNCVIDAASKRVLLDNGPGHFGQKAWDAITTPEYRQDFWHYLKSKGHAVKDLQLGLDEQAGFLAPADFIARIIGRMPAPTSVLSRVSRFATSRDKVILPKIQYSTDDLYTTGFRVTKTGELPATSTTANVTDTNLVGIFKVDVDTWMIRAVVTNDMLEDSAFPLEQWLADKFRETVDLLYEDQILNGNGINAPDGIMNNLANADKPAVVLSGAAGALAYDGLVNLTTELAPQYDENAVFCMSKKGGYRALAKLKDGNSRPLFAQGVTTDGLVNARQMQLLGYPVCFAQFLSQTVSSTTYPILFGDLRGQYHVDRIGFTIQVLRELYAETNRVVLLGRVRFGGGTAESWKMKIQKSNDS